MISWDKMYKFQKRQENSSSSCLVPALGKRNLDNLVDRFVPTAFRKILQKGAYNQQCIKY